VKISQPQWHLLVNQSYSGGRSRKQDCGPTLASHDFTSHETLSEQQTNSRRAEGAAQLTECLPKAQGLNIQSSVTPKRNNIYHTVQILLLSNVSKFSFLGI
jgi:hypothetical protein